MHEGWAELPATLLGLDTIEHRIDIEAREHNHPGAQAHGIQEH
jgi:hypothetical protein